MTQRSRLDLTTIISKLYEKSVEPIFVFDAQDTVVAMNPSARNILDVQVVSQIMNAQSFCLTCQGYTSEEEEITCSNCYLSTSAKDFSSFQVYLKTKDKGVIPYSASFQLIDEATDIRVLMLRDLTTQLVTQETLNQNKMMKSIIKAQEDERKRISRELHDSVAQELLSSLVDLRVIKYLNVPSNVLQKIGQTEASLTRLLNQIRNLSVELRPASLDDLGLEAAFRSHFKWIEQNYGLVVHYTAELHGSRFNSEMETVVYRVCQESLLNALKYAEVDEITVRLFEKDSYLTLLIIDDGCGFNVNMYDPQGTGLGLYGMKERAELVRGELFIISEPGEGTTVQLKIPIE